MTTNSIAALAHFMPSGIHGDGGNATVSWYCVCPYGTEADATNTELGDVALELVEPHAPGGGEDSV